MIIYKDEIEVEIKNWAIAEEIFVKWGYDVKQDRIEVKNIFDVTSELSAWGVPWKYK